MESQQNQNSQNFQYLKILGIPGSLRKNSYNRALLKQAVELAPGNMKIEIFETLGELPLFNEDVEEQGDPAPVRILKESIQNADAILIATPEYNYGIPGVLKNAIDWASRPPSGSVLNLKPAAIMGATPGSGGTARSQLALRQAFVFTDTYVLTQPEVLVPRVNKKFDVEGKLTDETTKTFLQEFLLAFEEWIYRFKDLKSKKRAA